MKLNAADLALAATAVDRAWRTCEQPKWSTEEQHKLLLLSVKLDDLLHQMKVTLDIQTEGE
jgi:hypothetical protein